MARLPSSPSTQETSSWSPSETTWHKKWPTSASTSSHWHKHRSYNTIWWHQCTVWDYGYQKTQEVQVVLRERKTIDILAEAETFGVRATCRIYNITPSTLCSWKKAESSVQCSKCGRLAYGGRKLSYSLLIASWMMHVRLSRQSVWLSRLHMIVSQDKCVPWNYPLIWR